MTHSNDVIFCHESYFSTYVVIGKGEGYIYVLRRPWELVIFSFAIDRLVKSCGKHHQLPRGLV